MSGNSFHPNDKSLADVEKGLKKKKNSIHTVDQCKNLTELSKRKKPRSKNTESEDVLDFTKEVNFANLASLIGTYGGKICRLRNSNLKRVFLALSFVMIYRACILK